ncbi:AF4/FMR2 family member 3, partial [Chaetura pelagica]
VFQEMTHSWPPPLSAIHTPGKAEQSKFPFPNKVRQATSWKSDVETKSQEKSATHTSMLEDDLKLSSDEEENDQQAAQRSALRVLSDSLVVPQSNARASGLSSKGSSSSSSSESETSSESDSETESSSSESDGSKASHYSSPEVRASALYQKEVEKPLHETKHHWVVNSHPDRRERCPVLGPNNLMHQKQCPLKPPSGHCASSPSSAWTLVPVAEEPLPVNLCSSLRCSVALALFSLAQKTGRMCESNQLTNCLPVPEGPTGKLGRGFSPERAVIGQGLVQPGLVGGVPAHSREPRSAAAGEKRRARGPSKTAPKSKEFIETESSSSSSSSDSGSESEREQRPLPRAPVAKDAGTGATSKAHGAFGSINARTSSEIAKELEEQFYTLVPFGRNELLSPLKDSDEVKSLWVNIDLALLSRIPERLPEEPLAMSAGASQAASLPQGGSADPPTEKGLPKSRRKRKCENEEECRDIKKTHLERESSSRLAASAHSLTTANHCNMNEN